VIIAIIREVGYRKVCARWVPKMLIVEHKPARKNICGELFQPNEEYGIDFLSRIITDHETRVHHYDPLTKIQSMEWHDQSSPLKINSKVHTCAVKVLAR
jgi:hypothetical protein